MTAQSESKVSTMPQSKPLHTIVQGKVLRVRRYDQYTYTTIICPAQDAYTRPSVVEIRSKSRFADSDEEVKVNCILGGYEGRAYRATDRETGESRQLIPVNLFLDLEE